MAWSPGSPDLMLCDFWLRGYLKYIVYNRSVTIFNDLKDHISQHLQNITPDALNSAVVSHRVPPRLCFPAQWLGGA